MTRFRVCLTQEAKDPDFLEVETEISGIEGRDFVRGDKHFELTFEIDDPQSGYRYMSSIEEIPECRFCDRPNYLSDTHPGSCRFCGDKDPNKQPKTGTVDDEAAEVARALRGLEIPLF